jgi:hypothetical protein
MERCSNPACWNVISGVHKNGGKAVTITGVPFCSLDCYQKYNADNKRLTEMGSAFYVNPRKEERQLRMNFGSGEHDECNCKQCTGDP